MHWHPLTHQGWGQKETLRKVSHQHLVTPSRPCSGTQAGFNQGFLSKEHCDNTGASPIIYWPDCTWNLPVLDWNQPWKDGAFCGVTDIKSFDGRAEPCSGTQAGFNQRFLSKQHCDNTGASPIIYWPDCTWNLPVLDWNQPWRDGAFCGVTDIKSFDGRAEMAFTKQLPGMCPTHLQSLTEVYICTRGLFWRKCSLYDCTVLYFLEIKWFWEHSEATMYDVRGDRVASSWSQIWFILLQPALLSNSAQLWLGSVLCVSAHHLAQ